MRFAGVDLAWGLNGGTGVCLVEDGRVRDSARLRTDEEILDWLAPVTAGPAVVAIDAPLVVRNATGRRRCETLVSRCFGAQHAGAHSSNLGLPAFRGGVRAERLAEALGLDVDPAVEPGTPVRRALEVYPHPALVALFELPFTLRYKAKRGRTLESRRLAMLELVRLLGTLRDGDPPLEVDAEAWAARVGAAPTQAALDRLEDELDAYVCACVGLYYWSHGLARCRVLGDVADGYIVTPVTAAHAAKLDALA